MASLKFDLLDTVEQATTFGPRLGVLSLQREDGSSLQIKTPGLITTTSRGVVPHLSRDHTSLTEAVRWVQLPFESFLERNPPIPTLQGGPHALHKFLGYKTHQHLLSLTVRDPSDGREMPANGKDHIAAMTIRGVRKITPTQWKEYMRACRPDVVAALSDVPFTQPPYSQKRITKSLERSTAWLADLLSSQSDLNHEPFNVLVHLVGSHDARARQAFSEGLVEPLYGKDAELIAPFKTLDEGVAGYILELEHLRASLVGADSPDIHDAVSQLCKASLAPLSFGKLRVIHTTSSPHDILQLVQDVGVDLFDAPWAHQAADLGIALDFRFPVSPPPLVVGQACSSPMRRDGGKLDIGHNLFDTAYAHDHSRFASTFIDAATASQLPDAHEARDFVCKCLACSPVTSEECLVHSSVDSFRNTNGESMNLPYTRAYVHHLLHTHEMSSHALLATHNLSVVDRLLADIRKMLSEPGGEARYREEAKKFYEAYDRQLSVFDEARAQWAKVERERGKGRLRREKDSDGANDAD
ncbi:Queuine tRNA-ribosyltransferase subunit [Phanerochaete sordida]|uniref:Queuine tRNA-ribosyltransferase subunit n=1 Tax=Phanerochaete sordida TaxID=48140 RepID=A0A9P3G3J2_9APHY|nr:Queuine tRNA-ribosyltransferase subunit [Phanerochaete sordida]